MRALWACFKQFIWQISRDNMLLVVCFSPIIAGIAFKFGLPLAEETLCSHFGRGAIFEPYYLLIDIFLAILTPYMFCFVSAMVILEEKDTGMASYYSVTPTGKSGYLLSRLVFPAVLSVIYSVAVLLLFSLTKTSAGKSIMMSILSAPLGVIIAMFIVGFSANKVEGMALTKLSGIIMLGVAIPFFVSDTKQYIGSLLPTFWVAKSILDCNIINLTSYTLVVAVWSYFLWHRFHKQIT